MYETKVLVCVFCNQVRKHEQVCHLRTVGIFKNEIHQISLKNIISHETKIWVDFDCRIIYCLFRYVSVNVYIHVEFTTPFY